jgi:cold shock CspA family protein
LLADDGDEKRDRQQDSVLLEAVAKFEACKLDMNLAAEGILTEWAVTVRDKEWPQARYREVFLESSGYGFITVPDESDVFVHGSKVARSGISRLAEGDVLTFELATNSRNGRQEAVNLEN